MTLGCRTATPLSRWLSVSRPPRRRPRAATRRRRRAISDAARSPGAAHPQDAAFPARVSVRVAGEPPPRHRDVPADTVVLPAGRHWLAVRSRRRETGQADEAPWVEAWKPLPPDLHAIVERTESVVIGRVAVDRLEVSEAQYARFCAETGYRPRVPHRHVPFLSTRDASADAAVTYVDLDDARAYARWRGARLPTPAEWQLAQTVGADRRKPLVWNLTDSERTDGITRYVLLKGGSDYAAAGSVVVRRRRSAATRVGTQVRAARWGIAAVVAHRIPLRVRPDR